MFHQKKCFDKFCHCQFIIHETVKKNFIKVLINNQHRNLKKKSYS